MCFCHGGNEEGKGYAQCKTAAKRWKKAFPRPQWPLAVRVRCRAELDSDEDLREMKD